MIYSEAWTRRHFLAISSATAMHAAGRSYGAMRPAPESYAAGQENVIPPPIVITGGVRPLMEGNTARPLRYTPEGDAFVIRNGGEFFNRPIYGPISSFRVDAGDRPEFSLYLPGHGGNLKLGFITQGGAKWTADADEVITTYRPGRMIYEIRDGLLKSGSLRIELLTAAAGSGLLVRVETKDVTSGVSIAWGFAGASGRKGRRNGDIGCEIEPVSQFFQVRPEECTGNRYSLEEAEAGGTKRPASRLRSDFCELLLTFPPGSQIAIRDYAAWQAPPQLKTNSSSADPKLPILTGWCAVSEAALYLTVQQVERGESIELDATANAFDTRSQQVEAIANTISFDTPDAFLNAAAPALGVVADALWDPVQQCVMHGCVAWRVALAGWRGPYVLDATGSHDRAKAQFRHWIERQNISMITTGDPATGPADPGTELARKEHLLHSNGDLSGNHYDMNMVFFDVLLRHLRWTGDLEFAREVWPAFERHLAWEHRLFRRTYTTGGKELPLYEAYAAIWASDNLQYSGGGAAHSSAYNVFSFRFAATLAGMLGEDSQPYEAEAELICEGMQRLLWLPKQGAFAESKDLMGQQTIYSSPALWTVYHTVDSEVPMPRQAWQMVAERLAALKHIPVHGEGVPVGPWHMLSCSDWMPYLWSLNLLLLAENMHFVLAMYQVGMADEAYQFLKGSLLDSMYQGLCPGDFHMTSELDVHRQEAQRDFGDPTGIASRALVEGLFGLRPDLIRDRITLCPGFPNDWEKATLRHRDGDLHWRVEGSAEYVEFTSRFSKRVAVTLSLKARGTTLPEVTSAGRRIPCSFDTSAVGAPRVVIELPPMPSYSIKLRWRGHQPTQIPEQRMYRLGERIELPSGVSLARIDDPQGCLAEGTAQTPGFHTVFVNMHEEDCSWTLPIAFTVVPERPIFVPVPKLAAIDRAEPVDLTSVLTGHISEIFERSYAGPRSSLCTLSIPDTLLGGWANLGRPERMEDAGLRAAGGMLHTAIGVPFRTPAAQAPNCTFLSWFHPDQNSTVVKLRGQAQGIYLLVAGSTLPQCSRMENARITVVYVDGSLAVLPLRNPENWWPIEQDYLIDDYMFVDTSPLPPRVDLRTGETRILDIETFKGKGTRVPGGAATIVHLPLDSSKELASFKIEVSLYGIVGALLAATLVRPL